MPNKSITKRDLEIAKNDAKLRSIKRAANLAALNDYIGFVVSKALGLTGLVVGGLEYLSPDLLPIVLPKPSFIAGAGLALLTGKGLISFISKLERSSK